MEGTIEQTDTIAAMGVIKVAISCTHVDDTRQTTAIACWETALIEVDILHYVRIERGEKT